MFRLSFWFFLFSCIIFIYSIVNIVLVLISIAYYTLAERKIMASIQRRKGPNVVGLWGLFQPLADGFKLFIKSKIDPKFSNVYLFSLAPILILTLSLFSWFFVSFCFPSSFVFFKNHIDYLAGLCSQNYYKNDLSSIITHEKIYDFLKTINFFGVNYVSVSLLFLLAISSFNVYGIVLAGWASNSKYAFLGSLRSAAQMISYEVSIGIVILPVLMLAGNLFSINDIIFKYYLTNQSKTYFFLLPCFIIFCISILAETNRTPFDLTEAEAELVAGYNVEYSSITFAMFFLAEYSNMLLMAAITVLLFFGSYWQAGWILKMLIFVCWFVSVRATFPRYKYNELMDIGWKTFLPISLSFLGYVSCVLLTFNAQLVNNWNIF